jgi:hypothetical protein
LPPAVYATSRAAEKIAQEALRRVETPREA